MDYDWLYDQYINKNRRSYDIAAEYGCKQSTIQYWLYKHRINKVITSHVRVSPPQYYQYEYLYREHINLGKSMTKIAEENNVSSDTIREHLKKNNIPIHYKSRRKQFSADDIRRIKDLYKSGYSANQISKLFDTSHRIIIRLLKENGVETRTTQEAQFNIVGKEMPIEMRDPDFLQDAHWNKNLSCKAIGELLGVDAGTIRRQMRRLGVKTKNCSESKVGIMIGEKHPNWRGGITPLSLLLREYFQVNLVPVVLKRDNYTCQLCGATNTVLHVHHITAFRDIVNDICAEHPDLSPANLADRQELYNIIVADNRFLDTNNLITFCKDCHIYLIHDYNRKTISNQASVTGEGSETIPNGSTSEAIADGNARDLTAQIVI